MTQLDIAEVDTEDVNSVAYIAAPTDRRPIFVASALSPAFRWGLLFLAIGINLAILVATTLALGGAGSNFALGELASVMVATILLALTFIAFLVFGSLLNNNPKIGRGERWTWYAVFLLMGPLALPVYWFLHVWNAPFEPLVIQTS
jgi:hypothetical protein